MSSLDTQSNVERYERLKAVYDQLMIELSELEREGRLIRYRLQDIVDKQKMKEVLEHIITQTP